MNLLVTTSRSLLCLDLARGRHWPIHRGAGLYYGLAASDRHYLVAARHRLVSSPTPIADERGSILVFDQRLRHIATWQAPFALRDLHQIAWHRGRLYATCSHDDLIAIREPDGRWWPWYPLGEPPGAPRDRHHFNSLHLTDHTLTVLAHNRGPSELLEFDRASLTLRRRLPLGVQAHDLWQAGGVWCTCSSGEGALRSEHGVLATPGQFPRGSAPAGQGRAIGLSAFAERAARDLGDGAVILYDRHWRERARHSLPGEGLVLDLLPLPGPFSRLWRRLVGRRKSPAAAEM